ncbi:hypothetical protein PF007_g24438 [Phytophthora fragariae]|uniref:Uncharacterized protein n=1 Tax=Phytophthora fragariae TaxID=53985 RepID=A0A6A3S6J4_9STRA|nr:hypothetical protein PF003_g30261 [Phytophthora fragariae]KAE8924190.1 hypothetical protein PF009_g25576 [Phytophthora fragariae]KAE9076943.1 hypothetical protein PF007_g24438 [Phytophthora fragariae]KAE9110903.1 hypothetical protein PF006_g20338 [Phytophthora fragariae]KAE9282285.1 hypothetical protein PF001_g23388 [Phytophthora fragariae]
MGLFYKDYMILGCSINVVAVHHRRGECVARRASSDMVILALVFVAMPSVGCIIAYVCEHTQRESVRDRGAIQAWYLIFRRFVSTVTSVLSFLALGAGSEPNMSVSACCRSCRCHSCSATGLRTCTRSTRP